MHPFSSKHLTYTVTTTAANTATAIATTLNSFEILTLTLGVVQPPGSVGLHVVHPLADVGNTSAAMLCLSPMLAHLAPWSPGCRHPDLHVTRARVVAVTNAATEVPSAEIDTDANTAIATINELTRLSMLSPILPSPSPFIDIHDFPFSASTRKTPQASGAACSLGPTQEQHPSSLDPQEPTSSMPSPLLSNNHKSDGNHEYTPFSTVLDERDSDKNDHRSDLQAPTYQLR
ncbi:hypothetical protein CkaCkLH20_12237 [Colletotrichum karsti]|uniref:Uncharacterized protein n=1 Tax=Colletotrichum karsti TaxID=1095194 RepID=A0A9P6HTF4_9PEZI|nr:uncharacterized protein CkaCkLH20_12237 [Colletotrichum karsti]KAF9870273.1 hypothetical protein CkaCkLH20_12237 [Colletotrichum karsti]